MGSQNRTSLISADALLPDVVKQYPGTRAIFDRYGLHGCGGTDGPRERIDWFARLHGVPLDKLLRELNEAGTRPSPSDYEFSPSIADTIYRPFFLAGIATVLTLGCMWGAINLLTIGVKKSFSSVEYSWVLAHGHAMVFGFVGFFIMGFAYQAFPRFKHTRLWRPRLAFSALPLMIAGIALQTIAHLLSPPSLSLEILAAFIQLISIAVFCVAITMTTRAAKKPESHDRFVYAALGWFLLAAIANPVVFKLFELPGSREELLFNLATYNIPYRDVQLLGIAVVMILGSLVATSASCLRFPRTVSRVASVSFLGSEWSDPERCCSFRRRDDWWQSLAVAGSLVNYNHSSRHSHRYTVSISIVWRRPGERTRSQFEIYSRGVRVVHSGYGDARVYADIQLRHLYAGYGLTRAFLTCLFWCLSSCFNCGFYHDDDCRSFQQSCSDTFRRRREKRALALADIPAAESRKFNSCLFPNRHRLLSGGL